MFVLDSVAVAALKLCGDVLTWYEILFDLATAYS